MRISAIVLGAGNAKAVAKPIKLLWIDRVDLKPALQQHFNHRAMRHLNGNRDRRRRSAGLRRQPITQFAQPGAAVRNGSLTQTLPTRIKKVDLVALRCPVDAHEPSNLICHGQDLRFRPDHRDACRSLYRRSRRDLPPDSVAAVLTGHQSATGARSTGDPGLLPTGRPGPASLQCRPSSWTHEGYRGPATTDSIPLVWLCRFKSRIRDRPGRTMLGYPETQCWWK